MLDLQLSLEETNRLSAHLQCFVLSHQDLPDLLAAQTQIKIRTTAKVLIGQGVYLVCETAIGEWQNPSGPQSE